MAVSKNQMFRILKEHYIRGVSQREIAKAENLSTATVSRLIKEAKDAGYVKITLNLPDNSMPELEQEIKNSYGVPFVSVVSAEGDDKELILRDATQVFEGYLNSIIRDGDVIGLSWGRTLSGVARHMAGESRREVSFVSMSGGVSTDVSEYGVEQTVRAFARVYGAKGYTFPLPGYLEDSELAKALMKEKQFTDLFSMIKKTRIAVFSVGPISTDSLLFYSGYFTYQGLMDLRAQGFVGDICSRLYRLDGSRDESGVYHRSVGISLPELKEKEHKLCIVLEADKAEALSGALRGGYVDALFIDEGTAKALLKM